MFCGLGLGVVWGVGMERGGRVSGAMVEGWMFVVARGSFAGEGLDSG